MSEQAVICHSRRFRGHRAASAWQELRGGRSEPTRIEALKERPRSRVYRLEGVGPDGSAVIAKWQQRRRPVERVVYQSILPRLAIPAVRCYGFVEEPDGQHGWLFLEDAGGENYRRESEHHRALAAQWLGLLHTSAAQADIRALLPDREATPSGDSLRATRDMVLQHISNPALQADDIAALEAVGARCETLAARWGQVERFCRGMPHTLIHGDLIPKNVRLRASQDGPVFFAFDWEGARWGVPALDLIQFQGRSVSPDIPTYWSVVREQWPRLGLEDVRRLADFGTIFRSLSHLNRASRSLEQGWVELAMEDMRVYAGRLDEIIQTAGWDA